MDDFESILEKYPFVQPDNLISILQDIQEKFGYLSEEAIVKVGKYLNMPSSKIYGLATFYNQFRFFKRGKYHIKVCNGTSCHINNNVIVINAIKDFLGIDSGEITKDSLFSFEETDCMASCGHGPVMCVNDKFYTSLNSKKTIEILESLKKLEE